MIGGYGSRFPPNGGNNSMLKKEFVGVYAKHSLTSLFILNRIVKFFPKPPLLPNLEFLPNKQTKSFAN